MKRFTKKVIIVGLVLALVAAFIIIALRTGQKDSNTNNPGQSTSDHDTNDEKSVANPQQGQESQTSAPPPAPDIRGQKSEIIESENPPENPPESDIPRQLNE